MTSCAATTTIREALWVCEDFEGDDIGCGHADHDEQHEKVCAALASLEQLVEAAEEAIHAVLPLLPLSGSWDSGYKVSETIQASLVALPEEWAEAAHAISRVHAALAAVGPGEEPAQ